MSREFAAFLLERELQAFSENAHAWLSDRDATIRMKRAIEALKQRSENGACGTATTAGTDVY